ncbi:helix-turn-helix domain-containing protein [Streptomyces sp. NPDC018031]|uniref:helix-turn-helix domain-containing protein n=1 Tax=Streptomyces sp. NPDC018031 TaxID=3365033 RepID=UPI00378BE9CC
MAEEERPAGPAPAPGDLGRRLVAARERRGLTREEAAQRAGMAASYLRYLEEQHDGASPSALVRLAHVLGTTYADLLGAGADTPPGRGRALARPELRDLSSQECRALLSTHGVGRVAVVLSGRPAVVPVNYEVVQEAVCFRTAPDSAPAAAARGTEVAFEVDHIDDATSRGWSVLATGPARMVTDPAEAEMLDSRAHTEPWPGGPRRQWVRIDVTRLTGRRIVPAE